MYINKNNHKKSEVLMNTVNQRFHDEIKKSLVMMLNEHLLTNCSTNQLLNLDEGRFVAYLNHPPKGKNGVSRAGGRIKVAIGSGNYLVIWTNKFGESGLAGKPTWFNPRHHNVEDLLLKMTKKLVGQDQIDTMVQGCLTSCLKQEAQKLLHQKDGTPCLNFDAFTGEELEFFATMSPYVTPTRPVENDGIRIDNGKIYFMGQPCPRKMLISLVDTEKLRWTMKHLYPNPQSSEDHQVIIPETQRPDWQILAGHIVDAISECRVTDTTLAEVEALAA